MAVSSKTGTGLKREAKELYKAPVKQAEIVDVPKTNFLMVDGAGDPNNSPEFQRAIEALYGTAYTLKFMLKKEDPLLDFKVMPLEGLWWTPGRKKLNINNKDSWRWTLMIALPPLVKKAQVNRALALLKERKDPPALGKLRFEPFREGRAVQIMHVGPYSKEGPAIEKMITFARENGFKPEGKHHEIYLGDPRRSAPERLRTVLRHPVVKAAS